MAHSASSSSRGHLKEGKSRDACVRLPEDFSKVSIPVVSIVVLSPLPEVLFDGVFVFEREVGVIFFFWFRIEIYFSKRNCEL